MRSSNNEDHRITKEIMEVIRINVNKNVKQKYRFKNELFVFTYYLNLFFTLSHTINLFYQTYLIYLIN